MNSSLEAWHKCSPPIPSPSCAGRYLVSPCRKFICCQDKTKFGKLYFYGRHTMDEPPLLRGSLNISLIYNSEWSWIGSLTVRRKGLMRNERKHNHTGVRWRNLALIGGGYGFGGMPVLLKALLLWKSKFYLCSFSSSYAGGGSWFMLRWGGIEVAVKFRDHLFLIDSSSFPAKTNYTDSLWHRSSYNALAITFGLVISPLELILTP